MRNIWLIARREYLYNFKRRSFLFTAFGVPAFSILMMFIIFNVTDDVYTETGQLGAIGYVDNAGVLADPVEEPEEYVAFTDDVAAHQALLAGEIGAYFVLGEDFFNAGQVDAFATENIPSGIEEQFSTFVKVNLARMVPDDVLVERILEPMDVTVVELSTGDEIDSEAEFLARFMTPFIFAFIFLMAINTTSQFLMSGVVEEKENRMMEILITSSTPLQMLWGKVLGLGALGLTQVALWGVAGYGIMQLQPESSFVQNIKISPDFIVIGLVYLVLGYFLFGAIMAGVGAAVTAEQEGRQAAAIFTMVAVLPMILLVSFIQDPNGTLPVVLSLVPFTSPMSMILRMPMTTVPTIEIVASLLLLVAGVVVTVWLAAWVFRIGLLMYGKRLTLREIVNAVRQGRKTMMTTAGEGN